MSGVIQSHEFDCLWLMAIIEAIIELTTEDSYAEDEILQSIHDNITFHATSIIRLFERHQPKIEIDRQILNELKLMTNLIGTNYGSPNEDTRHD